jgi:hypothetical protein
MEKKFSLREESRKEYMVTREAGNANSEDLRDGALLRMADTSEKSFAILFRIANYLQIMTREKRGIIDRYEHRIAGLRGYIKRMKKA